MFSKWPRNGVHSSILMSIRFTVNFKQLIKVWSDNPGLSNGKKSFPWCLLMRVKTLMAELCALYFGDQASHRLRTIKDSMLTTATS